MTNTVISTWLRPYFDVIVAGDGSEALKLVDDGNDVDVLVTDLDAEHGDGISLLMELRDRGHPLARRTIVHTAEPDRAARILGDAGIEAVIAQKADGFEALRNVALRM